MKKEVTFEIIKNLILLEEYKNGWTKEINLVSWNDKDPVIDIRTWGKNKEVIGKGITLTDEEFKRIRKLIIDNNLTSIEDLKEFEDDEE